MTSHLSSFSQAMNTHEERRKAHRAEFNRQLEAQKPVLFLPYPDTEGHGIGWFVGATGFLAYRKYSNGYDPDSAQELEFDLIRALIPHLPQVPPARRATKK